MKTRLSPSRRPRASTRATTIVWSPPSCSASSVQSSQPIAASRIGQAGRGGMVRGALEAVDVARGEAARDVLGLVVEDVQHEPARGAHPRPGRRRPCGAERDERRVERHRDERVERHALTVALVLGRHDHHARRVPARGPCGSEPPRSARGAREAGSRPRTRRQAPIDMSACSMGLWRRRPLPGSSTSSAVTNGAGQLVGERAELGGRGDVAVAARGRGRASPPARRRPARQSVMRRGGRRRDLLGERRHDRDVTRADELLRARGGAGGDAQRPGAVGGRDAGADALARLDGQQLVLVEQSASGLPDGAGCGGGRGPAAPGSGASAARAGRARRRDGPSSRPTRASRSARR